MNTKKKVLTIFLTLGMILNVLLSGISVSIPFSASAETTTNPTTVGFTAILYGDVNCDDDIDMADIVLLEKSIIGSATLTAQGTKNANVYADDAIDVIDCVYLLQVLVGKIQLGDLPIQSKRNIILEKTELSNLSSYSTKTWYLLLQELDAPVEEVLQSNDVQFVDYDITQEDTKYASFLYNGSIVKFCFGGTGEYTNSCNATLVATLDCGPTMYIKIYKCTSDNLFHMNVIKKSTVIAGTTTTTTTSESATTTKTTTSEATATTQNVTSAPVTTTIPNNATSTVPNSTTASEIVSSMVNTTTTTVQQATTTTTQQPTTTVSTNPTTMLTTTTNGTYTTAVSVATTSTTVNISEPILWKQLASVTYTSTTVTKHLYMDKAANSAENFDYGILVDSEFVGYPSSTDEEYVMLYNEKTDTVYELIFDNVAHEDIDCDDEFVARYFVDANTEIWLSKCKTCNVYHFGYAPVQFTD